ncbi:leucine-rich melanocyte differentiation-associated protein-like [Amphibalanus amphitrite]|uniref:leucine-rich melanocyte differentiation-associated protein-like n=1 Tax=Amphibalanus amphitrite TaxID=1232801 RepID=UPI001C90B270|nr:leucine-rich melanocyte differentiation-associated protein-like [Amphibalanus amphitrite]XP_043219696.1 leucine-rich melanocyte differentiation-associated protein-like [Amphibalanus amphitrite]
MQNELYNFIEESKELHVFASEGGYVPREVCGLFAKDTIRLNLSSIQLRTSKGLDMFPRVEEVVLDNNELTCLQLNRMPRMHTLSLNKNKIEELEPLLVTLQRCATRLTYLSLLGNPCSPDQLTGDRFTPEDYARHRLYVLYMLPNLLFLDSMVVSRKERLEAKRRGQYCRTARLIRFSGPTGPARTEWGMDALDSAIAPPPPPVDRQKRGPVYGQLAYRYVGKHSEGNRFIRNSDL